MLINTSILSSTSQPSSCNDALACGLLIEFPVVAGRGRPTQTGVEVVVDLAGSGEFDDVLHESNAFGDAKTGRAVPADSNVCIVTTMSGSTDMKTGDKH